MLFRLVSSCVVVSCRVVSCRVVSCRVVSCRVVSDKNVSFHFLFCVVCCCLGGWVSRERTGDGIAGYCTEFWRPSNEGVCFFDHVMCWTSNINDLQQQKKFVPALPHTKTIELGKICLFFVFVLSGLVSSLVVGFHDVVGNYLSSSLPPSNPTLILILTPNMQSLISICRL